MSALFSRVSGVRRWLVILMAAPVWLPAQEKLSSATLSTWRANGGAPAVNADEVVISAGTTLARNFPTPHVSARLVSRPFFSPATEGLPSLEVGPASVSFLRDQNGGALILLGDQPLQLPTAVPLGEDGRSKSPIDLTLSYDRTRATATLVVDGRTFALPATAPTGALEVALTAGAHTWPLTTFEVTAPEASGSPTSDVTPPAGSVPTEPRDGRAPDAAARAVKAAQRAKDFTDAARHFAAGHKTEAEKALIAGNRHEKGTLGWQLESANKYTHLALTLRQRYDHRGAIVAARRALELLQEAEKLSSPAVARKQATVHEMAAFLHEELLRDPKTARLEYEKASKLDERSVRAREGLRKLDAANSKSERVGAAR